MSAQGRLPTPFSPPPPNRSHDVIANELLTSMEVEPEYFSESSENPMEISSSDDDEVVVELEPELVGGVGREIRLPTQFDGIPNSPISDDEVGCECEACMCDVEEVDLMCDESIETWRGPKFKHITVCFQLRTVARS